MHNIDIFLHLVQREKTLLHRDFITIRMVEKSSMKRLWWLILEFHTSIFFVPLPNCFSLAPKMDHVDDTRDHETTFTENWSIWNLMMLIFYAQQRFNVGNIFLMMTHLLKNMLSQTKFWWSYIRPFKKLFDQQISKILRNMEP